MKNPHKITLKSPAKLNLFLHILDQRPDGYHNIQTLFQLIDWNDTLTFSTQRSSDINIHHTIPNLPNHDNLIYRAAKLLQSHTKTPYGCQITLNKSIPTGGGLGGGSSNAATTLLTLNHLWQTQLTSAELASLGRQIGADIPVFILGKNAWAEGVGDELTPVSLPRRWYLIIHPPCHVNTSTLFQHPDLPKNNTRIGRKTILPPNSTNHFQRLACELHPPIAEALTWLNQHTKAQLTGTGSCVFAAFKQQEEAQNVAQLAPTSWTTKVCAGINTSPTHTQLEEFSFTT
jgi:4-diphosphocytidyl-2-C-methyl-D-erythritol kinase